MTTENVFILIGGVVLLVVYFLAVSRQWKKNNGPDAD